MNERPSEPGWKPTTRFRVLLPLRHRDFRLLLTGQTISTFGNFLFAVALPFQVFALGGSAVELGLVFGIRAGMTLLLLLFGGAIADRLERRRIILASDFINGAVMTAIGALGLAGALRVEHLYVQGVVFGITGAFFSPALNAIIPDLVPNEILVQGNALRGFSRQAAGVIGPLAGGLLVATAGPSWAIVIDGVTFFASFIALSLATPTDLIGRARQPMLRAIGEGVQFVRSRPWLWFTTANFTVINGLLFGPLGVVLPIFVRDVLHGDARLFGGISAAVVVGEVIGGVVIAQVRIRSLPIAWYGATVLSALAFIGYGVFASVVPVLLCAIGFGIGLAGAGVLWSTALQRHVPRELRGRVNSLNQFGEMLLGPVTPAAYGAALIAFPPTALLIASGAIIVVLCAPVLIFPSLRQLE
jgi:MFS family permease